MKLPTVYQNLIHCSRYAKWLPHLKRRETWQETVSRTTNYLFKNIDDSIDGQTKDKVYHAILNQEVMPSMRLMMTAGKAHEKDNISGYNCCYLLIDTIDSIPETLYILMNGTGVGFSVESKYTNNIPPIPHNLKETDEIIVIEDSKLGWAQSLKCWLHKVFYNSELLQLDYSNIRPKGSRLKTFGGYASGHEPLKELIEHLSKLFLENKGKKLQPIDFHSIICKVASIVVVGGVRRSALISLSDLDDQEIATSKSGAWWVDNQHYALANNSAVYNKKPSMEKFLEEVTTIYKSHSGERGFFNRLANHKKNEIIGRDYNEHLGSNPCQEINLRATTGLNGGGQFCNLSEVIIRDYDTFETIKDKLELATIIGTIQASYTNFKFLRNGFKINTEKEALLGVSMTGIFDNQILLNASPEQLTNLKNHCRNVNLVWANKLNINPSASITTIKPSGTTSALNNTASGIHARFSKYYYRRIRMNKSDPITQFLIDNGLKHEPDFYNNESMVFTFPMKSPTNLTTEKLTALEHYNIWLKFNKYFCEHKASVTINYNADEYLELMTEVYKTWDDMTGISVLPRSEHTYKQAPFKAITEEQYNKLVEDYKHLDKIDFQDLRFYEKENIKSVQVELSCSAGSCEITNL